MATLSSLAKVSQNVVEMTANTVRNPVIWKLALRAVSGWRFSMKRLKSRATAIAKIERNAQSGAMKNATRIAKYSHPNWSVRSQSPYKPVFEWASSATKKRDMVLYSL